MFYVRTKKLITMNWTTFTCATFIVLASMAFLPSEAMRKQGVAVKGKFLCGLHPAAANSTKVRIVDIDTGRFFD
uniref:Uncharacterized protein n=1 Tax=Panagrolaimus sp. PS1159 TaxID=55785 RepID=A0AC35G1F9_9BILA